MWRLYLHDWQGNRLGELTDAKNVKLSVGISKNSTLTFDSSLAAPLASNLGEINDTAPATTAQLLADRDYSIITAYRWDPFNDDWSLQFSGPVFSTEEKGDEGQATLGVSAVGAYWRLSKRVANNADNEGKTQGGLAPAPATQYAFIADRLGNRIVVLSTVDGSHIRTFGTSGTGNGQLNGPKGIAIGPNGLVYVADTGNNRIQVFTQGGTFVAKWGGTAAGSGNTQFNSPQDIAIDSAGNVWVSDRGNNRVVKYDADGNYLLKVVASGIYTLANLEKINVAYDGFIYVAATDATLQPGHYMINQAGTIVAIFLGQLRESFAESNGSFLLVNTGGNAVRYKTGSSASSTINGSGKAQSIQKSSDGAVWVLESDATAVSRLIKTDSAGNEARIISGWGTGTGQTRGATGFAIARAEARDAIEIAAELIDDSNTVDGNSWIRSAASQGTSSSLYIDKGTWGGYKRLSDAIEELGAAYEWKVSPQLTTDGQGLALGEFYADATLGDNKSDLITFEFNTGKHNATDYTIKRSLEGLLNQASYPAADTNPYAITATDSTAVSLVGLFEEVISGSLLSQDLRRNVAELYLNVRAEPRVLIEITPDRSDQSGPTNTRVPIPLLEYQPGDIVGLLVEENGTDRIPPAAARVYDITIEIDENGKEVATLNLYAE